MIHISEGKVFKFTAFERKVLNWLRDGCSKPSDNRPALEAVSVDEGGISSTNGMMIKSVEREAIADEIENKTWLFQRIPANGLSFVRPSELRFPDVFSFVESRNSKEPVTEISFDPRLMINILKDLERPVTMRIYETGKINQPVELFGMIEAKEGKIERRASVYALLMPMHSGRSNMKGKPWKPSKPDTNTDKNKGENVTED